MELKQDSFTRFAFRSKKSNAAQLFFYCFLLDATVTSKGEKSYMIWIDVIT